MKENGKWMVMDGNVQKANGLLKNENGLLRTF
jgi:hypothetical protein